MCWNGIDGFYLWSLGTFLSELFLLTFVIRVLLWHLIWWESSAAFAYDCDLAGNYSLTYVGFIWVVQLVSLCFLLMISKRNTNEFFIENKVLNEILISSWCFVGLLKLSLFCRNLFLLKTKLFNYTSFTQLNTPYPQQLT
jgi:hypothetical protein